MGASRLPLLVIAHFACFFAPQLLSGSKQAKLLDWNTYTDVTRTKFQPNYVIYIIGYLLSKCEKGVAFGTASELTYEFVTMYISFSMLFYGGFVYTMNALSDLEDDRKEKPYRPLPSGKMSQIHAWAFTIVNLVLALISAFDLHGWPLVKIYVIFFLVNVIYSFLLRPLPILIALLFITVTSTLRLYMGAVVVGHPLPTAIYALAYLVYGSLHFTRKIIIQKNRELSKWWLLAYTAIAVPLILQLDLAAPHHATFVIIFALASFNYVFAPFIPTLRSFVAKQLKT